MLQASQELHKYFQDCKDVLSRILEKQNSMSDELGRDGASVSALQRKHTNFLQDLHSLQGHGEAGQGQAGVPEFQHGDTHQDGGARARDAVGDGAADQEQDQPESVFQHGDFHRDSGVMADGAQGQAGHTVSDTRQHTAAVEPGRGKRNRVKTVKFWNK